MNENQITIWVTQLNQADDVFFLRQRIFLHHSGKLVTDSWRNQAYVDDCFRKGVEPEILPPSYLKWKLFHVRKSILLDEELTIQMLDIQEGDVFVLTDINQDIINTIIQNKGIPEIIKPKDFPYGERVSIKELAIQTTKHKASNNPWISGTFYLLVAVVILTALAVISTLIPWQILPIILISCILIIGVIGALQLRNDELIDEKNFMKLMVETYKRLPLIRGKK